MEKSSEGPKTSDHFLRELIEEVRVIANEAEAFLNREPEELTE